MPPRCAPRRRRRRCRPGSRACVSMPATTSWFTAVVLGEQDARRRHGIDPARRCAARASGSTPRSSASSNQKVEPSSSRLSTPTRPPISSASSLTIARPRPLPPWRRVLDASTWVNASNTESNWSSAMPMPVSRTSKRSRTPCVGRAEDDHLEDDAAALGELDRVVEQVDEHLAQAHRVALDAAAAAAPRSCS